jgi:flagella basal body P-ring formation protein FlgA
MIRITTIALACLFTAPAMADENVFLRESLVVEGPHITLGDLFEIGGEPAAVVVARASAPGSRTAIDVNYVRRLAASHELVWANAGGLRRLSVSRASRVFSSNELTDILEGELFASEGQAHEVRLANTAMAIHAPVDSYGGPRVVSMNYDLRSGMFAADVAPYEGADVIRVTGRAYQTVEVPVLARTIAAGEEITERDLRWASQRGDRLRPDAVLNPDNIVGFEARRALRPGEPLREYDLVRPLMVARGELVTLVFESPGIQLSVRARAMENASDGELARFVNLQSNRTIEALVDGPGRARVGSLPTASF